MTTRETFLVVGGGLAGGKAVEALRTSGFDGHVVLAGAEHHLPYERPPLSKGYLNGASPLEEAFVHPPEWYDDNDIDLRLGAAVTDLDLSAHVVTVDDEPVGYDRLLVATGATPRRLELADYSTAPVTYLRTMEDSRRIKPELQPGRSIVVIGGGWIGLEVAAAARSAGCDVVLLEAAPLPLERVLGSEVAQVFADLHRSQGVDLRTEVSVSAIGGRAPTALVRLSDGSTLTADLLVVGVGVLPNAGLAEGAGLKTDNGIVVDEHLRSSDPDVFAAGDVANAYHPRLGRHLRVEHWDNAIHQGQLAAHNMRGGDEVYDRLPYFFTDQYDLGMEYVGNVSAAGYDEVVLRGDVAQRMFTAFWVKDSRVLAGMHVNDWDAIDPIRRIVSSGDVDLAALRDSAVPLSHLAS